VVHGRRVRIEHYEAARAQGAAVARALAGETADFAEVPYFWADLADWATLEYVGPAAAWDREILRGSFEDGRFTLFYLEGDRLAGALAVGRPDDLEHAKRLLAAHTDLAGRADALGDEDTDLAAL
jgi:3-phenylpropionate/trans-cinnamate dioxygenase ferredoxin reductase subunit